MASTDRLLVAALSDPGRRRDNNEDALHTDAARGVLLVVDGVGGHNAGEKAAQTAVEMIRSRMERPVGSVEDRIREAITVANNEIHTQAGSRKEWSGMACVLTLAVVEEGHVTVGHVGDSRLYLLRGGRIRKLTHDHSPVGVREDSGELSEDEAMRHPRRNEVYRDVGSERHTPLDAEWIEVVREPFPPDAALLLCSDGLTDLVRQERIRELVERHAGEPAAAARLLVDAANAEGGKDNVTVVVAMGERFGQGQATAAPRKGRRALLILAGAALLAGLPWLALRLREAPPSFPPETVPEAAGPRTLTVGLAAPAEFPTIATALEKAKPGDTVKVSGGQYAEPVRLPAGVALVGDRTQPTVLRAVGVGPVVSAVAAHGARLEGVVIRGAGTGTEGVRIVDGDPALVHVTVEGAETGVVIAGRSGATLRDCQVHGSVGAGVVVRDEATPTLEGNTVRDNGRDSRLPGILVRDAARPTLTNNLIAQNGAGAIWHTRAAQASAAEWRKANRFSADETPARQPLRVIPNLPQ